MILGVGIDIIEVARIASSYEKFGERFVNRILHADEIAYCLSHKNPAPFLAVRFSAKEAISKAFGTGICANWAGRTWKSGARNPASRSWSCTARGKNCSSHAGRNGCSSA